MIPNPLAPRLSFRVMSELDKSRGQQARSIHTDHYIMHYLESFSLSRSSLGMYPLDTEDKIARRRSVAVHFSVRPWSPR